MVGRMSSPVTSRPLAVGVRTADAMLGISRGTLYPLLMAGVIPSATINSRRVIRVEMLDVFLRQREAAGQP